MVGMIDLNTTEEDEKTTVSSSSPSSSSVSGFSGSNLSPPVSGSGSGPVCLELWHACAGPLISLPRKNSVVVYFPQGHLEQLPQDFPLAVYELPSYVFCRVVDVKLHAETDNDEVYAQVSLVPENEKLNQGKLNGHCEEDDMEGAVKSITPHMFCKTLTASDTSTHGGFSVPRRAAEDCFPPLDYSQQRPSQELVAKDLHGFEWKFRHIYRGQPRRHLLTTGWSAFVNKKKLVSGDAVLFLRGEDGELRLGIRRAVQVKCGAMFPAHCSQQIDHSTLTDVVRAMSTRNVFNICYNPRASSSEFIIPLHKFVKSLGYSFSVGMRFKMRFESEDAAERRYMGLITGISDLDPARWPGSKWRCLVVRWDDIDTSRHSRVSPWEIEPSGSISGSNNFVIPGLKRSRSGFPSSKPEFPIPDGIGASDFGESSRFQKVLQGQEIMSFNTLSDGVDQRRHQFDTRMCFTGSHGSKFPMRNSAREPVVQHSDVPIKGFSESYRFHKVLQGQEIIPSPSFGRVPTINNEARENGFFGISDDVQLTSSRNGWSSLMQGSNTHTRLPAQASSPCSVFMFQQAGNQPLNPSPIFNINEPEEQEVNAQSWFRNPETCDQKRMPSSRSVHIPNRDNQWGTDSFGLSNEHVQHGISQPLIAQSSLKGGQDLASSCKSSCRLFGFQLTEDRHVANNNESSIPATSLNARSFLPHVGEQFHLKPPGITNAIGSNCTKGILHQHAENYHIY
ncbi:auxin response factor 3-like isoform X2 [Mercurialis annua]|uniref:auxin response factor 3-like isoform X2 n=1 Tax=Mercurialis annua TaxID=3986 RepID=UPI00215E6124|nr:auxin response factor 3-like isoform X2 [Mercurialis annua]